MFLAIQVLLLLAGAGLSVFHLRLGLATWLALTLQFVSFMWMTVPGHHLTAEALVLGGVGLAAGLAMAAPKRRLAWWTIAATHVAVVAVLRVAMWLYWALGAPISGVSLATFGSSTRVLVLATTAGLVVGHVSMSLLLHPKRG